MDQVPKKVTDGLMLAMKAEIDGHNFYKMAALTTSDPKGKTVFEMMAQEEMRHYEFLKAQYNALKATGSINMELEVGVRTQTSEISPIFSAAIRERIKDAHYEMTALSVAIQLELSAMQFYNAEAGTAPDAAIRKFYVDLARWESGHYHLLLKQQELLRDDYWAEAGFAPF